MGCSNAIFQCCNKADALCTNERKAEKHLGYLIKYITLSDLEVSQEVV